MNNVNDYLQMAEHEANLVADSTPTFAEIHVALAQAYATMALAAATRDA